MRTRLLAVVFLSIAAAAGAQTPATVEVGGQWSTLALKDNDATPGVGLRLGVPVTSRVAIETRIAWFPEELQARFQSQGGKTFELLAGPRATFLERGRVSAYGVLLPGLIRFSDTVLAVDGDSIQRGSATHFALDMGAGVEFHVSPRWAAFVDWTGPLFAVQGTELGRSEPSPDGAVLVATLQGSVRSSAQFSSGLSYRFADRPSLTPAESAPPRWTIGTEFGSTIEPPVASLDGALATRHALGGFASYQLARWIDADGAVGVRLGHDDRVHTPTSGGRMIEAYGGAKLGVRLRRVGYFGKLRLGVQSFDGALKSLEPGERPVLGRANVKVVDYGAVIEAYPSHRLLARFDIGDVIDLADFSESDSIKITIGFGWRFQ